MTVTIKPQRRPIQRRINLYSRKYKGQYNIPLCVKIPHNTPPLKHLNVHLLQMYNNT